MDPSISDSYQPAFSDISLQESQNRLLYFYENASDLIHILRGDGIILYVNRAWLAATKYAKAEVLGHHIRAFVVPDSPDPGTYHRDSGPHTSHDYTTSLILCAKDGRSIELEASITLHFRDGNVVESLMMGRDVTARRATEIERRRAEARYRTAVQNLPGTGILMFDTSLRFTLAEGSVLEEAGFPPKAMRGHTLFEVLPPEQAAPLASLYRSALEGNTSLFVIETSPYSDKVFEITILPMYEDGIVSGGLIIAQDVTIQHYQEKTLVQAKEAAEAMAQTRHNFVANMSHEIRTPLNAIVGFTQLLAHTSLSPTQAEYVSLLQLSSENLLSLVNDVLDFSKADAEQVRLEHQRFNLYECLSQTIDVLAPQATTKGLTVYFDYDPTVPDEWYGDSGRLRQIVMNLMSNAIKFTDDGTITVQARTYIKPDGTPAPHIAVSDTGIGIAEAQRFQIFGAFVQADTTITRRHGGTGLGLAITKKFVEMMNGTIWVESAVGQGSTFHVILGLTTQDMTTAAFPREATPLLTGKSALLYALPTQYVTLLRQYLTLWGMTTAEADAPLTGGGLNDQVDLVIVESIHAESVAVELGVYAASVDMPPAHLLILGGSSSFIEKIPRSARLSVPLKPDRLYQVLHDMFASTTIVQTGAASPLLDVRFAHRYPLRILLVEDNPINQRVTTMLLETLGYTSNVVSDGFQALQVIQGQTFDVVLMDIQMPIMSGIETTRQLRALGSAVHQPAIVALTATTLYTEWDSYRATGFTHYLPKPIQVETLQQILRTLATPQLIHQDHEVVDFHILDRLAAALGTAEGRNIVQQIVKMYLEELPARIEALETAILATQWVEAQQVAHTLKGSSSTVGATALTNLCITVENHARQHESTALSTLLPELRETEELTATALATWHGAL